MAQWREVGLVGLCAGELRMRLDQSTYEQVGGIMKSLLAEGYSTLEISGPLAKVVSAKALWRFARCDRPGGSGTHSQSA